MKREAIWHLAGHCTYPLLVLLAVAGLLVSFAAGPDQRSWVVALDASLLGFATIALSVFYSTAAKVRSAAGVARTLFIVLGIMVLGAGIALGQSAAIYRGLRRRATPFRRTPKYRLGRTPDQSWRSAAYRIAGARAALADCTLGLTVLAITVIQLVSGAVLPTGMVLFLGTGSLTVGALGLAQRRAEASVSSRSAHSLGAPVVTVR